MCKKIIVSYLFIFPIFVYGGKTVFYEDEKFKIFRDWLKSDRTIVFYNKLYDKQICTFKIPKQKDLIEDNFNLGNNTYFLEGANMQGAILRASLTGDLAVIYPSCEFKKYQDIKTKITYSRGISTLQGDYIYRIDEKEDTLYKISLSNGTIKKQLKLPNGFLLKSYPYAIYPLRNGKFVILRQLSTRVLNNINYLIYDEKKNKVIKEEKFSPASAPKAGRIFFEQGKGFIEVYLDSGKYLTKELSYQ